MENDVIDAETGKPLAYFEPDGTFMGYGPMGAKRYAEILWQEVRERAQHCQR